ncbi:Uncharacterised protein [Mycobacteroides abscessus subsp. abscessus]|nr:Uncharacterised protein [Mycobacteroides abscessus subsp. abscessus]
MGRVANVLSIPYTASPLGEPGVSDTVDANWPASPLLTTLSVCPVSFLNSSKTDCGRSKESWVSSVT